MDHVAMLRKYLRDRESLDMMCIGYPFVTISRQAGAGGHTLAREIVRAAEKALPEDSGKGWEVFDHKLCLLLAQDPQFGLSFDQLLAEQYRSEISQVIAEIIAGKTQQYTLFKRIFEIVRALATIGKVVIVGRAGNCVTEDLPFGVRIRLVASMDTRVSNMKALLDVSEEEAVKVIRQQDKDRDRLIRDFFNRDINDPLGYDAIFNADSFETPDIAGCIVDILQRKLARFDVCVK